MNNLKHKIATVSAVAAVLFLAFSAFAQNPQKPQTDAEQEKKMSEFIQAQIDKMETSLKLESWQTFYVDSIMNHDFRAMQDEVKNLRTAKVSNPEIFLRTEDKWMEQMYNAFKAVLNEDQWARYLKIGAAKDKKMRDKRAAKNSSK